MGFDETMENVALAFEVVGVAIIVLGGAMALVQGLRGSKDLDRYFQDAKEAFGRPLILGLEILVAADIIKTITVELSLSSVATLGILVAVRIALSFCSGSSSRERCRGGVRRPRLRCGPWAPIPTADAGRSRWRRGCPEARRTETTCHARLHCACSAMRQLAIRASWPGGNQIIRSG